jgi:hypothetical protein
VPATTRSFLALAAFLGGLAFIGIVEFGISAGRVHHGVTVNGFEVGGLTLTEVRDTLVDRAHQVRDVPACLKHDVILLCVDPAKVGWRPEPRKTASRAYDVGRTGGLLRAISDRADAWASGVDVPWQGGPNSDKVGRLLDEWESIFEQRDLRLRRFAARNAIREALETWPRTTGVIPVGRPSR